TYPGAGSAGASETTGLPRPRTPVAVAITAKHRTSQATARRCPRTETSKPRHTDAGRYPGAGSAGASETTAIPSPPTPWPSRSWPSPGTVLGPARRLPGAAHEPKPSNPVIPTQVGIQGQATLGHPVQLLWLPASQPS